MDDRNESNFTDANVLGNAQLKSTMLTWAVVGAHCRRDGYEP